MVRLRLGMSMWIISPSSTRPIGPPAAASGEICPMQGPRVEPEKRPSVIKAVLSSIPRPTRRAVTMNISRIPGPPLGPSYFRTMTSPAWIFPADSASIESSILLNTRAFPVNTYMEGLTPPTLTTAPSGARFPFRMAIPPSRFLGLLLG